jgi:hypothetical protein
MGFRGGKGEVLGCLFDMGNWRIEVYSGEFVVLLRLGNGRCGLLYVFTLLLPL